MYALELSIANIAASSGLWPSLSAAATAAAVSSSEGLPPFAASSASFSSATCGPQESRAVCKHHDITLRRALHTVQNFPRIPINTGWLYEQSMGLRSLIFDQLTDWGMCKDPNPSSTHLLDLSNTVNEQRPGCLPFSQLVQGINKVATSQGGGGMCNTKVLQSNLHGFLVESLAL